MRFWLCSSLIRLFVLCNSCMELNNVAGAPAQAHTLVHRHTPMHRHTHVHRHQDSASLGFI